MPISMGVFELIHANRMRNPPYVKVHGLQGKYCFKIEHNDEISTRIAFIENNSGNIVSHPIPFSVEFSAEL